MIKTDKYYWAFVPNVLPPEIELNAAMLNLLAEANLWVGRLSETGSQLPNPNLIIQPYMRREAVESSRIEGTQTSLSDLFRFEAQGDGSNIISVKNNDVLEVANYVKAMEYGLKRLKELPLCLRLIKEVHGILMSGVRSEREYLKHPILYLSEYFEHNRRDYYDGLLAVSERGEWENWLMYFMQAIVTQSRNAIAQSLQIIELLKACKDKVQALHMSALSIKLVEQLFINPYITITHAAARLNTTYPTAKSMIEKLLKAGVVTEITGKQRDKVYCAKGLLDLLGKE